VVLLTAGVRSLSLLRIPPDQLWGPPSRFLSVYRRLSPGVRWLRRETNHSPPSVTEVKKEWSFTSSPPEYRYGVYRYNAVCLFLLISGSQSDAGI
jgi:hypothetical protein